MEIFDLKDKLEYLDEVVELEYEEWADNKEEFRMIEVGFRPTAEHFSKYFYELMSEKGFPIHRVEVYETPNNLAAYEE